MNSNDFFSIARRGIPFLSDGGRAFITLPAQSLGCHTLPIRSRAFRHWFYDQCFSAYDAIPSAHAFSNILHHLEAQAARDPDHCGIRVPFRVDSRGVFPNADKILLDLADPDGQFVEITPQGWRTTSGPGFPFETSPSSCPLPVPQPAPDLPPGADSPLDTLRSLLNLGLPAGPDWLRCLAWLLSTLRRVGPFPILILRGPSGSGKSTAARILRGLVDPSSSPFAPLPASPRELLTFARQNWILAFDHVSALTPQLADALCRISSGVGVPCREPRQPEPLQLWIKRPILLTVTDRWVTPPDLAARALTVDLPPLTAANRRTEHEIAAAINQAFPRILGALCTAVSQALAAPPSSAPSPTRHADALAWTLAAAPALNCTPREICAAFGALPPPDPFVDSVRDILQPTPRWNGTAAGLLQLLPGNPSPRSLAAQLNTSLLPLADSGIDVQFRRRHGGVRVIDLFASPDFFESPQSAETKEFTSHHETGTDPGFASPP